MAFRPVHRYLRDFQRFLRRQPQWLSTEDGAVHHGVQQNFYVVVKGTIPGLYTDPADVLDQISNIQGSYVRKFATMEEALACCSDKDSSVGGAESDSGATTDNVSVLNISDLDSSDSASNISDLDSGDSASKIYNLAGDTESDSRIGEQHNGLVLPTSSPPRHCPNPVIPLDILTFVELPIKGTSPPLFWHNTDPAPHGSDFQPMPSTLQLERGPRWVVMKGRRPGVTASWYLAHREVHGLRRPWNMYQWFSSENDTFAENLFRIMANEGLYEHVSMPYASDDELKRCTRCANGNHWYD